MMDLLQSLYNVVFLPIPGFITKIICDIARLRPIPKASIQSLPNEILFEIFSFLELKPYIICHGVCKKWQQLLPLTQMHPIRRRLLDLYRRILDTRDFEKTLEWTNQHLQPFNREEYVRSLLVQYPAIPEEFRMWILEWPARVVIHCIWPGLSFIHCDTISRVVRRPGVNWIAYRSFSPQLSSLVYKHGRPSQTFIPGLFIWSFATEIDWLIFEQDEPDLFGRVYITNSYYHSPGSIPYYPPRRNIEDHDHDNDDNDDDGDDDDTDSEYSEGEENAFFLDDWISYLDYFWSLTVDEILNPRKIYLEPDLPIDQPVYCVFGGPANDTLLAPRWEIPNTNFLPQLQWSD